VTSSAWGGIASLQLGLSVVWTGAASRGYPLAHIARWLATAPAQLGGLGARKGAIEPGRDADFVVFDPDASFTVEAARLLHRHAITPYDGMCLRGVVEQTILRGETVYRDGSVSAVAVGGLITAAG
jgi:allantoinase